MTYSIRVFIAAIVVLFTFTSNAQETVLSIEEYVKAYRDQMLAMQKNINGDELPVFVDQVKIEMTISVKKTVGGGVEFWVVQVDGGVDNIQTQKHELTLSFGEKGKQRVASVVQWPEFYGSRSQLAFIPPDLEDRVAGNDMVVFSAPSGTYDAIIPLIDMSKVVELGHIKKADVPRQGESGPSFIKWVDQE